MFNNTEFLSPDGDNDGEGVRGDLVQELRVSAATDGGSDAHENQLHPKRPTATLSSCRSPRRRLVGLVTGVRVVSAHGCFCRCCFDVAWSVLAVGVTGVCVNCRSAYGVTVGCDGADGCGVLAAVVLLVRRALW